MTPRAVLVVVAMLCGYGAATYAQGTAPLIKQVSSTNHTLVLLEDGSVLGWGNNNSGQLGEPTEVPGLKDVVSVAAGTEVSTVVLSNGSLRAWGNTGWGQIGAGVSGQSQPSPQKPRITGVRSLWASGNSTFALRDDGTLWFWGAETGGAGALGKGQKVPALLPWQSD